MACISSGMYKIKPIFGIEELSINSPMYSMKNLHTDTQCVVRNAVENSDNDLRAVNEIVSKQGILLEKIKEIKDLLALLKKNLSEPKIDSRSKDPSPTAMPSVIPDFSQFGVNYEVVLNASTKNPPNSLLALQVIWNNVDFLLSSHIHSSVKGLPKNLKKFEKLFELHTNNGPSLKPHLRIRVVWKEVWSDCELIISPLKSAPLLGEGSFLRFLDSSLTPLSSGSDPLRAALWDAKMDACHALSHAETIPHFQEHYNILSTGLDTDKFLTGGQPSAVDLALWSTVKNMKNPNLNPLLSRWYKDFENLVGFVNS